MEERAIVFFIGSLRQLIGWAHYVVRSEVQRIDILASSGGQPLLLK